MNPIIRQLQIDLITGDPNPIIDWFNSIWDNINVMETDVLHGNGGEFIYYLINEVIFFRDDNKGILMCNYNAVWETVSTRFDINGLFIDTQEILKMLLDNRFAPANIATPSIISFYHNSVAQKALMAINTPDMKIIKTL